MRALWSLRARGPAAEPELVVPDGCMELILNGGDPARQDVDGRLVTQPRAMLMGEIRRPVSVHPPDRVDMVGVRLAPGAAALLFDVPAEELVDRALPLDELLPPADRRRLRRVADADPHARLRELHAWMGDRLAGASVDALVSGSVRAIRASAGRVSASALARAAGVSERHLQRRFRETLGIGAKSFARVVRFRGVLRALEAGSLPWAHLAVDLGYADQSHLIRDFREFTSLTPVAWAARTHNLNAAFSGDDGSAGGGLV